MSSKTNKFPLAQHEEKIGLFFGSFNPVHVGHLIVSHSMIENGKLHKVWFVVTPQNPFKKNNLLMHPFDRYDLVNAAIADDYRFAVSDVEFTLPKPNYTAHTLAVLAERHPRKKFVLLMGEDNLLNFARWKNQPSILAHHEVYVYPRPRRGQGSIAAHPHIKHIEAPVIDISATYIRQAIKNRKSIRYLVPPAVEQMIYSRGFYGA